MGIVSVVLPVFLEQIQRCLVGYIFSGNDSKAFTEPQAPLMEIPKSAFIVCLLSITNKRSFGEFSGESFARKFLCIII